MYSVIRATPLVRPTPYYIYKAVILPDCGLSKRPAKLVLISKI